MKEAYPFHVKWIVLITFEWPSLPNIICIITQSLSSHYTIKGLSVVIISENSSYRVLISTRSVPLLWLVVKPLTSGLKLLLTGTIVIFVYYKHKILALQRICPHYRLYIPWPWWCKFHCPLQHISSRLNSFQLCITRIKI